MFIKHYAPNRHEPSIEVIMKMVVQLGGGGGQGFFLGGGCQGGCVRERRIEVIVKIHTNEGWGSGQSGCE